MNNFALIKIQAVFVYSPFLSCLLGPIVMGEQKMWHATFQYVWRYVSNMSDDIGRKSLSTK